MATYSVSVTGSLTRIHGISKRFCETFSLAKFRFKNSSTVGEDTNLLEMYLTYFSVSSLNMQTCIHLLFNFWQLRMLNNVATCLGGRPIYETKQSQNVLS